MILKAFSIYDGKTSSFLRPFFEAHTGSALRSFEEACSEPTSPFHKFPTDFVLYEVGTFEDSSGVLTPHGVPVHMATALEHASRRSSSLQAVSNV